MFKNVWSFAVTPPVHSNNIKIRNPPVVGFLSITSALAFTTSHLQRPKKLKKIKTKLGFKIYVLKCTLYVRRNVQLGFFKILVGYLFILFELCQAGLRRSPMPKDANHRPCTQPHCRLPPKRDRPLILSSGCITYRRILNFKSQIWWHSDRAFHAARAVPIECFNRSTTKPLSRESLKCYCAKEKWQQKSIPASGIFKKIKPDSNDKMNRK